MQLKRMHSKNNGGKSLAKKQKSWQANEFTSSFSNSSTHQLFNSLTCQRINSSMHQRIIISCDQDFVRAYHYRH